MIAQVRFNGNSKAVIEGETDGYMRIVARADDDRVIGASLVGPHVTELVHELVLAARAGLTLDDVAATIHAHPTLAEAVGEAALGSLGRGHAHAVSDTSVPRCGRRPCARGAQSLRAPPHEAAGCGRAQAAWLRVKVPAAAPFRATAGLLDELDLHTVCDSARCPNRGECFAAGTATFLILGDACTRACGFCAIGRVAGPAGGDRRRRAAARRRRRAPAGTLPMWS